MSEHQGGEDPAARSGILKAEFGVNWRWWRWFRYQFTPTSLSAIGVILTGAGGYIVHLRHDVDSYHEQVVIYRTEIAPVLRESKIESINAEKIDALDGRVSRIERNIDLDLNERLRLEQRHRTTR